MRWASGGKAYRNSGFSGYEAGEFGRARKFGVRCEFGDMGCSPDDRIEQGTFTSGSLGGYRTVIPRMGMVMPKLGRFASNRG